MWHVLPPITMTHLTTEDFNRINRLIDRVQILKLSASPNDHITPEELQLASEYNRVKFDWMRIYKVLTNKLGRKPTTEELRQLTHQHTAIRQRRTSLN
jgi:hypothetical protein